MKTQLDHILTSPKLFTKILSGNLPKKIVCSPTLSVARDPASKKVVVQSRVFAIRRVGNLNPFFPQDNEFYQNFFYVVVNPGKRTLSVLYNAWLGD